MNRQENKTDIEKIEKLDFPLKIRKLAELAENIDRNYAVHGSGTYYRYGFNPPAEIEEVRAFEREYEVKLPEMFFRYLTEVGNGGAGVDYGIYTLDEIRKANEHLLTKTSGKVIFEYEDIFGKWKELALYASYYRKYYHDENNIEYKKIISEMLKGLLVIGTNGCTYVHVVICEGKYTGMTGMIDMNLEEHSVPFFYGVDFENWICSHFRNIALGNVTRHRDNFWTVNK